MFKSIQWKIIAIFLLLTMSVMIVVGTFLLQNISAYYHDDFATTLSAQAFTPSVCDELNSAAKGENSLGEIENILGVYSIRMMIDSFRNYYILDAQTCSVLSGSSDNVTEVLVTPNILCAMAGETGDDIDRSASYMDYAVPVKDDNGVKYIVYIIDSKEEIHDIIKNIFINILWALLFGLLISAFLGLILSRTIILPISNLQIQAEQLSEGEFGQRIEVKSDDEIGRLTMAFNIMAAKIDENLYEIASEKSKVEAILAQMTDGVVAFSTSGEMIHSNIAAREFIGTDNEITFNEFVEKIGIELTIEQLTYLEQDRVVERNGEVGKKIIRTLFAPYSNENEQIEGIVVVMQDVTEQTKLESARREFVANVSHELRTPITTIKSYAETILDMAEEESAEASFVKVIETEADRMAKIVSQLLTLSRLDNSATVLDKNVFDLSKMVEGVVDKLTLTANNHKLELSFVSKGETKNFFGDKDRLEQVVINIVSNAIKYTPEGGKVQVVCGTGFAEAFVRVIDNGIGIPKKDLPRVFERFYRVDKARSRESGGTGLGLAIAKELVELHGGKINIESRENKGTEVTITLPMINVI